MATNENKGSELIKSLLEERKKYKCTFEATDPDELIKLYRMERDNFYISIYENEYGIINIEGYVNASKVLGIPLKGGKPRTTGPSDKLLMWAFTRYFRRRDVNIESVAPALDKFEELLASLESQIREKKIQFEPL